jgi:hypothetical protein
MTQSDVDKAIIDRHRNSFKRTRDQHDEGAGDLHASSVGEAMLPAKILQVALLVPENSKRLHAA